MPKSLWNGLVVFALIFIAGFSVIAFLSFTLAYSKGYKSADQEHEAHNAQRDTADIKYSECLRFARTLKGALECVNDTEATSRESLRAEQDLTAQREMAQWAKGMLWATIFIGIFIGLPTLAATFIGVRSVYNQLRVATASYNILKQEQKPWLVVEIDHKGTVELTENGFTEDGKSVREVWFVIKNVGKSAAIVSTVYRRWSICNDKPFPDPIPAGGAVDPAGGAVDVGKRKDGWIPIGSGGSSGPIRTLYIQQFKVRDFTPNSRIYFDGYIEFRDIDGKKFIAGFCIIFEDGRFAAAWPYRKPEQYHYQYPLGPDGKPTHDEALGVFDT